MTLKCIITAMHRDTESQLVLHLGFIYILDRYYIENIMERHKYNKFNLC